MNTVVFKCRRVIGIACILLLMFTLISVNYVQAAGTFDPSKFSEEDNGIIVSEDLLNINIDENYINQVITIKQGESVVIPTSVNPSEVTIGKSCPVCDGAFNGTGCGSFCPDMWGFCQCVGEMNVNPILQIVDGYDDGIAKASVVPSGIEIKGDAVGSTSIGIRGNIHLVEGGTAEYYKNRYTQIKTLQVEVLPQVYDITDKDIIPESGEFKGSADIEIKAPSDADVYYTLNGSKPDETSTVVTKGQIKKVTLYNNTTVKAYATAEGYENSPIITSTYTVSPMDVTTESPKPVSMTVTPSNQGSDETQKFIISIIYDSPVAALPGASDEFLVKLNNVERPAESVSVSASVNTLNIEVVLGFALYGGQLTIVPRNTGGITKITDQNIQSPIEWENISLFVPNGLTFQTVNQRVGDSESNTSARVTKRISSLGQLRGMVHVIFLSNGVPVGELNQYGASVITHYHNYLVLTEDTFAPMIVSALNTGFGANYIFESNGGQFTATAKNVIEGEVLDIRIIAYPQDRDTGADKSILSSKINEASAISGEGYTKDSYQALLNEIDRAEAVNQSIYYLQNEVDSQVVSLNSAINSLELKKEDEPGTQTPPPDNNVVKTIEGAAVQNGHSANIHNEDLDDLNPKDTVKVVMGQFTMEISVEDLQNLIGTEEGTELSLTTGSSDANAKNQIIGLSDGNLLYAFDLNLNKHYGDGSWESMHNLGQKIKITINMTQEQADQISNGAKLMYFDSENNKLVDMNAMFDLDNKTITFYTDHFSSYAIVLDENSASGKTTGDGNNNIVSPKTGDYEYIEIIGYTMLLLAAAGALFIINRKKQKIY